jgi:hypothetical protein
MKLSLLLLVSVLFFFACKQKKKTPEKKFISIPSIIKSQVAHVDTSLYPILKIVTVDTLHSDTTYIRRENFAEEAKEFLGLPDLSDKKVAKRFKEEILFDQTINRAVVTYTSLNPASEIIQKQEVLVNPDVAGSDNVTSIIITSRVSNRDSAVQKNMLWQMDKNFQIVTIRQYPGKSETTTTVKVTWNEEQD